MQPARAADALAKASAALAGDGVAGGTQPAERWARFGPAMLDAGYGYAHASATMLVVQTNKVDLDAIHQRIEQVLATRVVIEQAKGVLAETEGVDMATAYQLLLRRAESTDDGLTAVARTTVTQAERRRG